ncbi:MAG: hypothetical protein E7379_03635 [Clostridiales bacterium]|nr:hypothetical protein [Clostridiales bacterium]
MNIGQTLTNITINKNKIKAHKDLIEEKRQEFEQSIENSQQIISQCSRKNAEMLNKKVRVSFPEFLKALAEKWNCQEADIKFRLDTHRMVLMNSRGKLSKELVEKKFLEFIKLKFFSLIFSTKKDCATIVFKSEDLLDAVQSDGKTFLDHLQLTVNKELSTKKTLYFECNFDDFDYFVIEKSLKELIYIGEDNKIHAKNTQYAGLLLQVAIEQEKDKEEAEAIVENICDEMVASY